MASITHDCPYCTARHAMFAIKHSEHHPSMSDAHVSLALCGGCGGGVVVNTRAFGTYNLPADINGDLRGRSDFVVISVLPVSKENPVPDSVPEKVGRAFQEGCASLKDSRYSSAVAMFRRALELALKDFSPEIEAWKLEKRIDKLAAAHLITPDMKQWAHEIRAVGNDALHEDDEPSAEESKDLRLFTEMLLIYLYTLPAKMAAKRAKP